MKKYLQLSLIPSTLFLAGFACSGPIQNTRVQPERPKPTEMLLETVESTSSPTEMLLETVETTPSPTETLGEAPFVTDDPPPDSLPDPVELAALASQSPISGRGHLIEVQASFTSETLSGSLSGEQRVGVSPEPYTQISLFAEGAASLEGQQNVGVLSIAEGFYEFGTGMPCQVDGAGTAPERYTSFFDLGMLLTGTAQPVQTGLLLNGFVVNGFGLTEDHIQGGNRFFQDLEVEEGLVYVDAASGQIIRLYMTGTGQSSLLSREPGQFGAVYLQLDFIEQPAAKSPPPPARCEDLLPPDFPYPAVPDGFGFAEMPQSDSPGVIEYGSYLYLTAANFDEVAAFYMDALPGLGWIFDAPASFIEGNRQGLYFFKGDPSGPRFYVYLTYSYPNEQGEVWVEVSIGSFEIKY